MPAVDPNFKALTLDDIFNPEEDWEYKGKQRTIVLGNGNELYMECVDPFGHWKISLKRGKLPDALRDGSWTTFRDCLQAANLYLKDKKHPIVYTTERPAKEE